jgi:hypothetical protein
VQHVPRTRGSYPVSSARHPVGPDRAAHSWSGRTCHDPSLGMPGDEARAADAGGRAYSTRDLRAGSRTGG